MEYLMISMWGSERLQVRIRAKITPAALLSAIRSQQVGDHLVALSMKIKTNSLRREKVDAVSLFYNSLRS